MPAESLGAIFDRFVQAQNRRAGKSRGTGLGLAFCRKVMDAHQGLIWAESEEGKGSSFHRSVSTFARICTIVLELDSSP